jgi:hypothetical protein
MLRRILNFVISWFSTLQIHKILGNLPMVIGFIAHLLLAAIAVVYELLCKNHTLRFISFRILSWAFPSFS